jgi:hypothetical protein
VSHRRPAVILKKCFNLFILVYQLKWLGMKEADAKSFLPWNQ